MLMAQVGFEVSDLGRMNPAKIAASLIFKIPVVGVDRLHCRKRLLYLDFVPQGTSNLL